MTASACVFLCLRYVFSLFHFVFIPSFLIYYRQHCVFGDDGRGLLLGRHGRQGGQKAVSAHLHVHKWLLRLPVVFCAGLWLLPALPRDCWLWVSLFPFPHNLWYIFKILHLSTLLSKVTYKWDPGPQNQS